MDAPLVPWEDACTAWDALTNWCIVPHPALGVLVDPGTVQLRAFLGRSAVPIRIRLVHAPAHQLALQNKGSIIIDVSLNVSSLQYSHYTTSLP